jgi:hypothetical protein
MSARVAMLRMREDGLIQLPAPRCKCPDPSVRLTEQTAPKDKNKTQSHLGSGATEYLPIKFYNLLKLKKYILYI